MKNNTDKGRYGEDLAAKFLQNSGYRILAKNWRYGHKEIDIIAKDVETIVIVEVKLRSNDFFGYPEQAVNRRKQKLLIEAADAYLEKNNLNNEVRYDVVAIIFEKNKKRLLHIKDAFIPGL